MLDLEPQMTPDWNAIRLELLQVDEPMRAALREMRPFFAKSLPGIGSVVVIGKTIVAYHRQPAGRDRRFPQVDCGGGLTAFYRGSEALRGRQACANACRPLKVRRLGSLTPAR